MAQQTRAHEIFMEEAAKCSPPLDDGELATIWQSACRFAQKVQAQEGYVSPDAYNDEFCRESLKPADYSDIGQAKVLSAGVWRRAEIHGSHGLYSIRRAVLDRITAAGGRRCGGVFRSPA